MNLSQRTDKQTSKDMVCSVTFLKPAGSGKEGKDAMKQLSNGRCGSCFKSAVKYNLCNDKFNSYSFSSLEIMNIKSVDTETVS